MASGGKFSDQITLIAGEALEPYRRVKYDGSTAASVVYADASDGDSWIGVTLPGPDGDGVASGDPVTIDLRAEHKGLKCECSAAVTANASIYPEDDGKISDDAGTVVIGTAQGSHVGSGDGSIIVFHPNAGSGSAPDEEAIANADATSGAGIVIGLIKTGMTAAATTHEIKKPSRKLKPIKAWGVLRDGTTNTDVVLKVGGSAICSAVSFTSTDELLDFELTDAVTEIEAASTVYASVATACTSPGVDVYLLCLPVA